MKISQQLNSNYISFLNTIGIQENNVQIQSIKNIKKPLLTNKFLLLQQPQNIDQKKLATKYSLVKSKTKSPSLLEYILVFVIQKLLQLNLVKNYFQTYHDYILYKSKTHIKNFQILSSEKKQLYNENKKDILSCIRFTKALKKFDNNNPITLDINGFYFPKQDWYLKNIKLKINKINIDKPYHRIEFDLKSDIVIAIPNYPPLIMKIDIKNSELTLDGKLPFFTNYLNNENFFKSITSTYKDYKKSNFFEQILKSIDFSSKFVNIELDPPAEMLQNLNNIYNQIKKTYGKNDNLIKQISKNLIQKFKDEPSIIKLSNLESKINVNLNEKQSFDIQSFDCQDATYQLAKNENHKVECEKIQYNKLSQQIHASNIKIDQSMLKVFNQQDYPLTDINFTLSNINGYNIECTNAIISTNEKDVTVDLDCIKFINTDQQRVVLIYSYIEHTSIKYKTPEQTENLINNDTNNTSLDSLPSIRTIKSTNLNIDFKLLNELKNIFPQLTKHQFNNGTLNIDCISIISKTNQDNQSEHNLTIDNTNIQTHNTSSNLNFKHNNIVIPQSSEITITSLNILTKQKDSYTNIQLNLNNVLGTINYPTTLIFNPKTIYSKQNNSEHLVKNEPLKITTNNLKFNIDSLNTIYNEKNSISSIQADLSQVFCTSTKDDDFLTINSLSAKTKKDSSFKCQHFCFNSSTDSINNSSYFHYKLEDIEQTTENPILVTYIKNQNNDTIQNYSGQFIIPKITKIHLSNNSKIDPQESVKISSKYNFSVKDFNLKKLIILKDKLNITTESIQANINQEGTGYISFNQTSCNTISSYTIIFKKILFPIEKEWLNLKKINIESDNIVSTVISKATTTKLKNNNDEYDCIDLGITTIGTIFSLPINSCYTNGQSIKVMDSILDEI